MKSAKNTVSASYAESGVNVQAGYDAVRLMREHVARTLTPGVLGGLGGFGGMFELLEGIKHLVLMIGASELSARLEDEAAKMAESVDRKNHEVSEKYSQC